MDDIVLKHQRAVRTLGGILTVAVAVSVVHYADNYLNYDDYPPPRSLPDPGAGAVLAAWFGFTAAGLAGFLLFRRRPSGLALVLVAAYSVSGLIGIGHYLVPGATAMPWWRQLHVGLDIACGIGVLAFVLWALSASRGRARPRGSSGGPSTP